MKTKKTNTQDSAELIFPRKFSSSAKEQYRKDILSILFTQNNSLLSSRDTEVIRMTLVEGKNLTEIGDRFYLSPTRVSEIFNRAINRINLYYATINEQLKKANDMENEINFLNRKLKRYEESTKPFIVLPLETREMLSKNITEFDFSLRIVRFCLSNDYNTLADLLKLSKYDIMRFRNVGKQTFTKIDDFITSKGLSWDIDYKKIMLG